MLKRMMMLVVLGGVAGCAGTQQATSEPAASPMPAPQSVVVQAPEPAPALVVADVTPVKTGSAAPKAADEPYHYQCMLAWAKGMQDALMPWTHTAEACDTRAARP